MRADYDYDADGRLVSLTYSLPAGSDDAPEYDWTFDAAGRMTQMVSSLDGTADYTNDLAGQLTDADYNGYQTDESYTYDAAGNRLLVDGTTSYTTGEANRLLSDGTFTYTYDDEGNRLTRTRISGDPADDYLTEYTWDNRNRLTQVVFRDATASHNVTKTVTYTYDFQNRWLSETVTEGESVERAFYVYDGTEIIAQFEKSTTGDFAASDMTHRELWNPQSVDQLFAEEEVRWDGGEEEFVTDQLLWALTDHQNSIRDLAVYDAVSEETTIAAHRVFDAYGNVTVMTGTAESIFGYTGRPFDEATGLQNNLNRWYEAITGRWLSEDPIGYDGGTNLYEYADDNPLSECDPFGLSCWTRSYTWPTFNFNFEAGAAGWKGKGSVSVSNVTATVTTCVSDTCFCSDGSKSVTIAVAGGLDVEGSIKVTREWGWVGPRGKLGAKTWASLAAELKKGHLSATGNARACTSWACAGMNVTGTAKAALRADAGIIVGVGLVSGQARVIGQATWDVTVAFAATACSDGTFSFAAPTVSAKFNPAGSGLGVESKFTALNHEIYNQQTCLLGTCGGDFWKS